MHASGSNLPHPAGRKKSPTTQVATKIKTCNASSPGDLNNVVACMLVLVQTMKNVVAVPDALSMQAAAMVDILGK